MTQEVSTQSWLNRIGSSLVGACLGIAFIIGAFIFVFWNEGNSLHTALSLQQTQQAVIDVANQPIDKKNNMRVVHITGTATTDDILEDKIFGISERAIKLNRHVEMYQWQEKVDSTTEKELGGSEKTTKTYSYDKVWSEQPINSEEFKEASTHQNPASLPIKSKITYAKMVTVGDYQLPENLVEKIDAASNIDLSTVNTEKLTSKFKKPVQASSENLYFGEDANTPKIGDVIVTISKTLPVPVSVIGQQTDNTLQPYLAPAGEAIILISMGQASSQTMIRDAEKENILFTWIFRAISLLCMIIGLALIMRPISVLADVVPFFGTLVGIGTGIVAFIGGFLLWILATACAWFTVRPLLAIGLIIAVVVLYSLLFWLRKAKKPLN